MDSPDCIDSHVSPELILSPEEQERLTFWKWRYSLEALGFTQAQAASLAFVAWMRMAGRC